MIALIYVTHVFALDVHVARSQALACGAVDETVKICVELAEVIRRRRGRDDARLVGGGSRFEKCRHQKFGEMEVA